ncbi:MAG: transglycosylase domain-containing protein [Myxococcaceae bacterium]|nr:transglycosylase domain-containing protein [Myxococcaceae bacterium]
MAQPVVRQRILRWVLAIAVVSGCVLLGTGLFVHSEAGRKLVLGTVRPRLEARLGEVTLGDHLRVGVRGQLEVGPLEVRASNPAAPPVLRVERVAVYPRLRSLLLGRLEVGAVRLVRVEVEAGRDGEELRALLARVRRADASQVAQREATPRTHLPRLDMRDVTLAIEHGGRRTLGPFDSEVEPRRTDDGLSVDARVSLPGGSKAKLKDLRFDKGLLAGELEVHDASLSALVAGLGLQVTVDGGQMDGVVKLDAGRATLSGTLRALTVAHPRLDEAPVGPFHLAVDGALRWQADARRLDVESLRLVLGPNGEARAAVSGSFTLDAAPRFSLALEVDRLPYQAAVDALPPALAPGPEVDRLEGVFGAKLGLEGPLRDRAAWTLTGKLDLSGLRRAAHHRPPFSLQGSFTYVPRTAEGRGRPMKVGPENPAFVPLTEVPPLLVRAVLLSEDAGFFGHRGFDFDSLADNLFTPEEDGPVRGGSTLTQQLAKNLFLSREKTFARKVREALLTLALEASLPKERMLEIYFNIIEWGPGLYGLGEASWHYFGKPPSSLTVKEMVFLATIIPGPLRYHVYCQRGATTEVWERRMLDLLEKLHRTGDLDEASLARAVQERLLFVHGDRGGPGGVDEEG